MKLDLYASYNLQSTTVLLLILFIKDKINSILIIS